MPRSRPGSPAPAAAAWARPRSVSRSPCSSLSGSSPVWALCADSPWRRKRTLIGRRSLGRRRRARDDVDEVLQVARRPALEGAVAIAFVGGHHRVAVVPVELRLRVQPEEAPGPLGDAGEDVGVWLAAVGARAAQAA